MKTSIQIGKIMGIPIKLHITFLLILPVFAWMFARTEPQFGGFQDVEPELLRYSMGMAASVLLFTCVLLHELGHSYVAKKHGSDINSITLFLFGGVSSMEDIPRDPKTELKMAVAGPAVSLLIGSILIMIHEISRQELLFQDSPYMRLVWLIGYINIVLCIFNLIPAFPMDGGRVLRAWLAGRMSYIKATQIAAGIGKMFAIFMGIFGLFSSIIWLTLIAFFIYIGASEEEKSTEVSVILEGVKVKAIMSKEVQTVSPETTVEELVDIMFKYKHMGYPVMDGSKVKGIVTFTDVQKVIKEDRKNVKVSQIMTKELITAREDDDAITVLKLLTRNSIGRIIVKNDEKMIGIISRTDVLRAVQLLE
ncbi:MAG: CBS domain-containing protein [Candidatus Methanoperedens sp.]|jgi:Zn-dependent protease/CBS domain-containing protein|nr:CBS domain-containing protein [Candidatus Methanoperedens sp.]